MNCKFALWHNSVFPLSIETKIYAREKGRMRGREKEREIKRGRESANLWVGVASTILWQKEVGIMEGSEDTCQAWGFFT